MKQTLILCGLPGSGKTTVGLELAKLTTGKFVDLDRLIEQRYGDVYGEPLTCRQISASRGELFFRQCESEAVTSLQAAQEGARIIALGGGTLEAPANVSILRSLGYLIFLDQTPDLCFERLMRTGTPTYLDPTKPRDSFLHLYERRLPHYRLAAQLIVEVKLLSSAQIASKILLEIEKSMRLKLKSG
jgi:shikimate kinase